MDLGGAGHPSDTIVVNSPSVTYQSSIDRVIPFVVGRNGHLYDKYWTGTRWVWESQGTPPNAWATNSPSAVYQSGQDRVLAFVEGTNGQLYDKYWDGQQWVWEPQGQP